MVPAVRWRQHINRVTGGLACCAAGLALAGVAAAVNADLVAFQTARQCTARDTPTDGCYAWQSGRVAAVGVGKMEDSTGPGRVDVSLSLELPGGRRTVTVPSTFLPPGRPRVGDTIEAKVWRGQVTDVRLAGVTVSAVSQPATRLLFLVEVAIVVFVVGLLLLVARAIDA
jgi:hypothetical protein